jgi:hypothetical protein
MSLQIRRGIDSQRTGVIFDEGEISWTTDTKKLYVGDGSTAGGVNVIASAAGTGLTWNNTTQTLNFSGAGLGLTTDVVTEGVTYGRVYFTNARAQTAVSSMFTTLGTAPTTGNVTGAISPSQITVSGGTSGMNPYIPFTVTGTGGQGLTAGTYYICTIVDASHITLSSTLLLAQAGTVIATFTTGSITGTTYSAGGGGGDVYFTYNPTNQTISANVTLDGVGITSVSQDTSPALGGNLTLNGYNISGTGNISITGALSTSGTANFSGLATLASASITNNATVGGTLTTPYLSSNSPSPTTLGYTINTPLYIGTNTKPISLSVSSSQSFGVFTGITNGTNNSGFVTQVSRGTLAVPTVVQPGDFIFYNQAMGYDGTNFQVAGAFGMSVDQNSTVTAGHVPGEFGVVVIDASGNIQQFTFNSKGVLLIPNLSTTGLTYYSPNYISVSSTTTYSLSATQSYNMLLVTTGSLTATINMPTSPTDGQVTNISVLTNTVTLAVGTGTVSPSFAGSAIAGTAYRYVYRATGTTWYRI